jgi:hypothetical protein
MAMWRRAGGLLIAVVATLAGAAEPAATPRRLPPPGGAVADLAAKLAPAAGEAWAAVPTRLAELQRRVGAHVFATDADRVDVEVLLDALEGLADVADEPLRYLLALQLVRRRVLRIIDEEPDAAEGGGTVVFACRKRGRDYRVRAASPAEAAAAAAGRQHRRSGQPLPG